MYTLLNIINKQPYLILLIVIGFVMGGIFLNTHYYNMYLAKKMDNEKSKYHGVIPPIMNKVLITLGTITIVLCFFIYPMFTKVLLPTSLWYDNSNPDNVIGFMSQITPEGSVKSFYTHQLSNNGPTGGDNATYKEHSRYIETAKERYYLLAWGDQLWMISKDGVNTYTKISSTLEDMGFDHEPSKEEMDIYAQKAKENTYQQYLSRSVDLGQGIQGWVEVRIRPLPDIYITKYMRDDQFLVDISIFVPSAENNISDIGVYGKVFEKRDLWFMYEVSWAGPNPIASEALAKNNYYSTQFTIEKSEYTPEFIASTFDYEEIYLTCKRGEEDIHLSIPLKDSVINEFE